MTDLINIAVRARNKARFAGTAHHMAAERASRKNIWIGVPVVIFSSIVATSIFGSISEAPPSTTWQIITGFVALTAAVLSALQTFFRFAEQSQMHLAAATNFLAMRRKLDVFLVRHSDSDESSHEKALQELEPMLEELESIGRTAPVVSNTLYHQAKNEVIRRILSTLEQKLSSLEENEQ